MLIAAATHEQPMTHLQVVKAPRKPRARKDPFEGHPFRAIGIPIIYKRKCIAWQLRLCFEQKLEPLTPKKKLRGWQLPENETPLEREIRIAKGIKDRDSFMQQVGDLSKYNNMKFMAKKAIMAALNKSKSMRGMGREQEDSITMEFLHETIEKVSRLLELGTKNSANVCGYCYIFIDKDAARFVRKLDKRHENIHFDDQDDDDDANQRSTSGGAFALSVAEITNHMEGHPAEFSEFLSEYVFDWVGKNLMKDKRMAQDVHIFTLYYHSGKTIKEIKEMIEISTRRVKTAYENVKNYVLEHVTIQEIQEAFGKKIMEGCNCE